jgi:hypothetical protein
VCDIEYKGFVVDEPFRYDVLVEGTVCWWSITS